MVDNQPSGSQPSRIFGQLGLTTRLGAGSKFGLERLHLVCCVTAMIATQWPISLYSDRFRVTTCLEYIFIIWCHNWIYNQSFWSYSEWSFWSYSEWETLDAFQLERSNNLHWDLRLVMQSAVSIDHRWMIGTEWGKWSWKKSSRKLTLKLMSWLWDDIRT